VGDAQVPGMGSMEADTVDCEIAADGEGCVRSGRRRQCVSRSRQGLVGHIRSVDALLKTNQQQIKQLVTASGSTLTDTVGIAAITAGRLIGRTGTASRFPTAAAFVNYAGTAPIEVASAERSTHPRR
jgi:transposase